MGNESIFNLAREGAARCSCSRTSHKRDVNSPVHGTQAGNRALLGLAKEPRRPGRPRKDRSSEQPDQRLLAMFCEGNAIQIGDLPEYPQLTDMAVYMLRWTLKLDYPSIAISLGLQGWEQAMEAHARFNYSGDPQEHEWLRRFCSVASMEQWVREAVNAK